MPTVDGVIDDEAQVKLTEAIENVRKTTNVYRCSEKKISSLGKPLCLPQGQWVQCQ